MNQDTLPVGSIVYLKEGTVPLVIVASSLFVRPNEEDETMIYFDYSAAPYPEGLVEESAYYFHHENIAEVVFTGYKNDQFERYLKAVEEWKETNPESFKIGSVE